MIKYLLQLYLCLVLVPDGNRRDAKGRFSVLMAHRRGAANARKIIKHAFKKGIQHVVFLAATRANLMLRSKDEVENLFSILKSELKRRLRHPVKGVRVYVRGSWAEVHPDKELADLIRKIERETAHETEHHLTFLFGHNGEDDYEVALRALVVKNLPVTHENIRTHLPTAHLPYIDLIIRTGVEENGEAASRAEGGSHWTNWSDSMFLPHLGHAQICSTKTLWPNFTEKHLDAVVEGFLSRQRRLGK